MAECHFCINFSINRDMHTFLYIAFAETPGFSIIAVAQLAERLLLMPGFEPRVCLTAGQRTTN
jgi:hypothetical protein